MYQLPKTELELILCTRKTLNPNLEARESQPPRCMVRPHRLQLASFAFLGKQISSSPWISKWHLTKMLYLQVKIVANPLYPETDHLTEWTRDLSPCGNSSALISICNAVQFTNRGAANMPQLENCKVWGFMIPVTHKGCSCLKTSLHFFSHWHFINCSTQVI